MSSSAQPPLSSTQPRGGKPIRVPRWVDREFPDRALFCTKHCYGPMDTWYDCQECTDENWERAPKSVLAITFNEKREPTEAEREAHYAWPASIGQRGLKVSAILKKIPREAAEEWLATRKPRQ